jgi:hypothetical protein
LQYCFDEPTVKSRLVAPPPHYIRKLIHGVNLSHRIQFMNSL